MNHGADIHGAIRINNELWLIAAPLLLVSSGLSKPNLVIKEVRCESEHKNGAKKNK